MAVNWSGAAKGALAGAGVGTSLFPGWGTLGGGLIGGALGLFGKDKSGALGGRNDEWKQVPTGTPQMEGLQNSILSQAMGMGGNQGGYGLANQYYNNLLGENQEQAYNQFAAPYLQQFQEQMLPKIAEQYAGAGALSSSGFGQALGGATSDFQSRLAQLFSSLQEQAASQQYGQYNQLAQTGLGYSPFAYYKQKGNLGFGNSFGLGASENYEGIVSGIASLFKNKGKGGTGISQPTPNMWPNFQGGG